MKRIILALLLSASASIVFAQTVKIGEEKKINNDGVATKTSTVSDSEGNFWSVFMLNGADLYVRKINDQGEILDNAIHIHDNNGEDYNELTVVSRVVNNKIVATWRESDINRSDVYFLIYDIQSGASITGRANSDEVSVIHLDPSVTFVNENGDFVIAWVRRRADNNRHELSCRKFDANAFPLSDEIVLSDPQNQDYEPAIKSNLNGNILVVWEFFQGGSRDIRYCMYDEDFNPTMNETILNTERAGDQENASVDISEDGSFAIVWQTPNVVDELTNGTDIVFRTFDPNRNPEQNAEQTVNTNLQDDQSIPDVCYLLGGELVITWESEGQDGSEGGIYLRRFGVEGNAIDPQDVLVNTSTVNGQIQPHVAANQLESNFAVVWSSSPSDDAFFQLMGDQYNYQGLTVSEVLQINTNANANILPSVVIDNQGQFIVVFEENRGNGNQIKSRKLELDGQNPTQENRTHLLQDNVGHKFPDISACLSLDYSVIAYWNDFAAQKIEITALDENAESDGTIQLGTGAIEAPPRISINANGNGAIVWTEIINGKSYVKLARFNASNRNGSDRNIQILGDEIVILSNENGPINRAEQIQPDVWISSDDVITVVWQEEEEIGNKYDIKGSIVWESEGEIRKNEFELPVINLRNQSKPRIHGNSNHQFVVSEQRAQDLNGDDLFVYCHTFELIYNQDQDIYEASPLYLNLNASKIDHQFHPSVAMIENGAFLVSWHEGADGASGVWYKKFSDAGTAVTGNIKIADNGINADIAVNATQEFVIAYEHGNAIEASTFQINLPPTDILIPDAVLEGRNPYSFSTVLVEDNIDEYFFEFVEGEGDDHNALFTLIPVNGSNGEVFIQNNQVVNYEEQNQYTVRIKVSDRGGYALEKAIVVHVADVDEAPSALNIFNDSGVPTNVVSIKENTGNRRLFYFTTDDEDNSDDPENDPDDSYTYIITGEEENNLFTIVDNNLMLIDPLNFEDGVEQFVLEITSSANRNPANKIVGQVIINLTDVNEAPQLVVSQEGVNIPENVFSNAGIDVEEEGNENKLIAMLSAEDEDDVEHIFTITNGDNDHFQIINGNELRVSGKLSHEEGDRYTLEVTVEETRENGRESNSANININILDINEAPQDIIVSVEGEILEENGSVEISENTNVIPLVVFSTIDEDEGNTYTYTITGGDPDGKFVIGGNDNNELRLAEGVLLNFEEENLFLLEITSTENNTADGYFYAKTIRIEVIDENDPPTALRRFVRNDTEQINENETTVPEDFIGTIVRFEIDDEDDVEYRIVEILGGNDEGKFEFDGLSINTAGNLDFESTPSYELEIRIAEIYNEEIRIADVLTFVIDLTDVNDAPNAIIAHNAENELVDINDEVMLSENLDEVLVLTLSTLNQDDDNEDHSYTITAGNEDQFFAIEGNQLRLVAALDHETDGPFQITIRSTESERGENGLFLERPFTIRTINLNEAPTAIVFTNTNNQVLANEEVFTFNDSVEAGTSLLFLSTEDVDIGDTHVYSIVSGNDENLFTIQNNTLRTAIVEWMSGVYTLIIRSTDAGGLHIERTLQIEVFVTSLEGENLSDKVNVFPNPAAGNFNLHLPYRWMNKDIAVSLYDMSGKIVSGFNHFAVGENVIRINNNLESGIYLIRIQAEDSFAVKRLIVD